MLEHVDLAIPRGTITALVGLNGAGKSTLIRSWIGFEHPSRGSTRVNEIDPAVDPKSAIASIGYVSQSSGLYRGLRVVDHLDLAETLRSGFDRDLATDRLHRLRIPLDRRAGDLSGGQQAHVALALALGTRAPILLMDEPLASLDPLARHEFLSLLVAEVRSRDATVVLSSHIVSDVEIACDSVVILGSGHVMLHARIADALASHRLTPVDARDDLGSVSTFGRPGGDRVRMVVSANPALEAPTLEELVMGYLAAAADALDAPGRSTA